MNGRELWIMSDWRNQMFGFCILPSSQRRGGRDIKKISRSLLEERTGWSLTSHISECVLNTACERPPFLDGCALPGLRGLRPPSAPLRRLRDIFLVAQPPLLCEEGSIPSEPLWLRRRRLSPCGF